MEKYYIKVSINTSIYCFVADTLIEVLNVIINIMNGKESSNLPYYNKFMEHNTHGANGGVIVTIDITTNSNYSYFEGTASIHLGNTTKTVPLFTYIKRLIEDVNYAAGSMLSKIMIP